MGEIKFIGYPEATIYKDNPEQTENPKSVKKTLWGDYVEVYNESTADYQKVRCRSADGWIKKDLLQDDRVLEVNFVDVGQGDGCFIVVPDKDPKKDRFILVDAGEGNNMAHFLSWRFNFKGNDYVLPIEYMIITHPDADHFKGFDEIVNSDRYRINKIYHNGIVPRKGADLFGPEKEMNDRTYLSDVCDTQDKLKSIINDPQKMDDNDFLVLMKNALSKTDKNDLIETLEYGKDIPDYSVGDLTLKVLGPVTTKDDGNTKLLPTFGGDGPTKNGNSIVLLLKYKKVRIFLSGDLNKKSQKYLAEFYLEKAGITKKDLKKGIANYLNELREVFEVDITKANHHGSDDYMYEFLQGVNPLATVISSGDNETFTHPRPDTLGVIGKTSRSNNPLIFSTELARSAKEKNFNDQLMADILKLQTKLDLTADTAAKTKEEIQKKIDKKVAELQRNIAVYGMITVRTDGERIIIAQKKERKSSGFQIFKISPDKNGELAYEP